MYQRMTAGVVLAGALAFALGSCTSDKSAAPSPPTHPPSASTPTPSTPSGSLPPGSVIGPPAVRVLTLASSTATGSKLDVVGPEGAKYRLRIGKAVDSCTQTAGPTDAKPLPGLPPNATHNVALKCASGADRGTVIKTATLLVTAKAGDGFDFNFEVALDRDL
jgi:uncharacterized lipoprotein YbaY